MERQHFYDFGPFRLNSKSLLLLRDGAVVPVAPKALETLLVLVENGGSPVAKDELMKRVWPDTFVEETNLTQQISLLRKILNDKPGGASYIETLPKRGYRFTAPLKTEVVPVRQKRPAWVLITAVIALITSACIGAYLWRSRGALEISSPAIAVLPFLDMSGDKSQEYFTDGLTEELIDALAKAPGLRVVARTSSFAFKGKQQDIRAIGGTLKVGMVVEGSVRQMGERLRITAQLNSARDGLHIWSDTYDRDRNDIFAIQEEIARAIVAALKIRIAAQPNQTPAGRHTPNLETYSLYLKGRSAWNEHTAEASARARQYFEEAIRKDPNFALAYAGLADAYVQGPVGLPPHEAIPKARAAARRAIEIDDRLAEPHGSMGSIHLNYDWDWPGAEEEYKRAITLNPNYANAHHGYSHFLTDMGRHTESLREAQKALDLDPLEPIVSTHMEWRSYYARQYDQALGECRRTLRSTPSFLSSKLLLGMTYEQKRMYPEAIAAFQESLSLSKDCLAFAYLGNAFAVAGRREEALRILGDLQNSSKERYASAYCLALVYTGLGDKEHAFEWLDRAYVERAPWMVTLKVEPQLDSLRSYPRFGALMAKMGFSR